MVGCEVDGDGESASRVTSVELDDVRCERSARKMIHAKHTDQRHDVNPHSAQRTAQPSVERRKKRNRIHSCGHCREKAITGVYLV